MIAGFLVPSAKDAHLHLRMGRMRLAVSSGIESPFSRLQAEQQMHRFVAVVAALRQRNEMVNLTVLGRCEALTPVARNQLIRPSLDGLSCASRVCAIPSVPSTFTILRVDSFAFPRTWKVVHECVPLFGIFWEKEFPGTRLPPWQLRTLAACPVALNQPSTRIVDVPGLSFRLRPDPLHLDQGKWLRWIPPRVVRNLCDVALEPPSIHAKVSGKRLCQRKTPNSLALVFGTVAVQQI